MEHPSVSRRNRAPHLLYGTVVTTGLLLGVFGARTPSGVVLGDSIPYAFVLFVLVLLGIGMFHHHTLYVALTGAVAITLYTGVFCPGRPPSADAATLWEHFVHEGQHTLLNLGGLMLGFTLLADLFERSRVADNLIRFLPKRRAHAAFALLALVWFMSSFLDNIAAAMIGGVMALRVFRGDVSVAYLAAIVAASNAGGAWSVLGDTTTTMMWIDGVPPGAVFHCIVASAVALVVFGLPGARAQARRPDGEGAIPAAVPAIDWLRVLNVGLILVGAIATNLLLDRPYLGVWAMLFVGSLWRAPTWGHLLPASKGTAFLLALVWCASLMPVQSLPAPSWGSAFALGFLSSVFDNIPLTKLALEQGHYDWGVLSFAVGFGGSMLWFGSSAGVTLAVAFPQLRHTSRYLVEGWSIAVAYVLGFFALLLVMGWHPTAVSGH